MKKTHIDLVRNTAYGETVKFCKKCGATFSFLQRAGEDRIRAARAGIALIGQGTTA